MDIETRAIPGRQQLRCTFTEPEMLEMGRSLCELLREQGKIAEEMAATRTEFKARLADVAGRIGETAGKIHAGYEVRDVRTETRLDFRAGIAKVIRLDTGEIIEERGLLNAERQMILDVARDSALDTLDKAALGTPEPPEDEPPRFQP
jgi:hypothetical protein